MNKLPIVAILCVFLLAISAPVMAQRRSAQKSGGARAAYGEPVEVFQTKKKAKRKSKKKQRKKAHKKDAAPLNRNRKNDPWVN